MISGILGIDLGTSSVKLIYDDGKKMSAVSEKYDSPCPKGWFNAICKAAKSLDLSSVKAVGLSSQVGTYIINEKDVIGWNDAVDNDGLNDTLRAHDKSFYIDEISMPHPSIASYPIPRLRYIKKHFDAVSSVMMPKDMIIKMLCGKVVSDKYSWRGLCNLETGKYSKALLDEIGVDDSILPPIMNHTSLGGRVTKSAAEKCRIPENTPVYVGCNDFFAAISSLGIENNALFDITGTSEHLGIISAEPNFDTQLVSGPYFSGYATYGVTAASGTSLNFALSLDSVTTELFLEKYTKNLPIFLPYLNGERAPIFDQNARGVFFGIDKNCDKSCLALSVFEGVVFSLYHIYETLGGVKADYIATTGGASKSVVLNLMKATMFDLPVRVAKFDHASATGAVIAAAVGCKMYDSPISAARECCGFSKEIMPAKSLALLMAERFKIYKSLYPALKNEFEKAASLNYFERN